MPRRHRPSLLSSLTALVVCAAPGCGGEDGAHLPAVGAGGSGGEPVVATTGSGGQATGQGGEAQGGGSGGTSTGAGGETTGGSGGIACTPEVCGDGIDNDCDQQVDEGCPCSPGVERPCYSADPATEGVGPCVAGVEVCGQEGAFGPCSGEVVPKTETCNGLDDDCDGSTDDLGDITCGLGQCAATAAACTGGEPGLCTPKAPSAEVCDGLDNDCDGSADDGNPGGGAACSSGQPGVCGPGTLTCQGGSLGCVQDAAPSAETCDGLDNDCDGSTDEGSPGVGSACSTGLLGVCSGGTTNCLAGVLACNSTTQASAETCNGQDDDCDGSVDDGNPGGGAACDTGLPGICGTGALSCQAGALVCQQSVVAGSEICDGLDNDCDGTVDDGVSGGAPCTTGLPGVCSAGTASCSGGALTCIQNVQSSAELCNTQDDDCDGTVDDGNPGGGAACTTGLLGACGPGTMTCQAGALACKQNAQPKTEVCSNLVDDDCDGKVDAFVYFSEDFSDKLAGWALEMEWAIGPTAASTGQASGFPDPALDHTPTADNGVAGVVLGGNAQITTLHGMHYLTSPVVDTASATTLYLQFWRWLNTDSAAYMANTIDVYNGSTWVTIWTSADPAIEDAAWTKVTHDVSAHKNANLRVRFGFATFTQVWEVSSWNIDDVSLTSMLCN